MSDKPLKAGDAVRRDHSQGTTDGKVVRKVTRPVKIKGHKAAATKDDPQYIVRSDRTGAEAAHRPSELRKI